MSKLADAMRQATRPEARPIGFAATAAASTPTMLVLARAGAAEPVKGVTALITAAAAAKRPEGVALWGTEGAVEGRDGAKRLKEAGADFVIFDDESTNASVLLEEDLGYVMRIDLDASDTFLRTVEGLPLDALLVPALDGALTVRRTLDLRRIASFARKPLFMPVTAAVDPTDLEALRACGVIGIVTSADDAAAVQEKVAKLPRRRPRESRAVDITARGAATPLPVEEPSEDDDE